MFYRSNVNIIKIFLVPLLEILASRDYQENIWVNNPSLKVPYGDIWDEFFEISDTFFSPGEEYQLDDKNRAALKDLNDRLELCYAMDDIQTLIKQSDWLIIRQKAQDLLNDLRPVIKVREQQVIESELIPAFEELSSKGFQEQNWTDEYKFFNWITDFFEMCKFWLNPYEESLSEKNKERLKDLYRKTVDFEDTSDDRFGHDIPALINSPDWIEIQHQAAELLIFLKNRHEEPA